MRNRPQGFTLIELMVVVAIVAILLALAIPSYQTYLLRSAVRAAQADLAALSMNLENALQRQLAYPTTSDADTTAEVIALFPGWSPAQEANFQYSYTPAGTPVTSYTVAAAWAGVSERLSGCSLSLTSANVKTMSEGCQGVMGSSTW